MGTGAHELICSAYLVDLLIDPGTNKMGFHGVFLIWKGSICRHLTVLILEKKSMRTVLRRKGSVKSSKMAQS